MSSDNHFRNRPGNTRPEQPLPPIDPRYLYGTAPIGARFHVAVRRWLFPFAELLHFVPNDGPLVDLGCGHGLWTFIMATNRPKQQVIGLDPDADRIALASYIARSNRIANVKFEVGTAEEVELAGSALISVIDVMYLISYERQRQFLETAVAQLRPGGRLLIKEMSERPFWKYAWNWIEETLVVRALRITYGQSFYFRKVAEWETLLNSLGLRVQTLRLDTGYIHPHVLFVGEKP